MKIKLSSDYNVLIDDNLLGYVGEHQARTITFYGLTTPGADRYKLRIEYSDSTSYEIDITSGSYVVDGSVLKSAQTVRAQIYAVKTTDDSYELVKKTDIFKMAIKPSLNNEPAPIPTYEDAKEYLDQILDYISVENGLEFENRYEFPSIGVDKKLYIAKDEDVIYRFNEDEMSYVPLTFQPDNIKQINGGNAYGKRNN